MPSCRVICTMLLMSVVAANAFGDVQYALTDLGTLGGSQSRALAINSSGQVVGWSAVADGSGSYHAFLYSGTRPMQDLGTLGGASSWAYGISDSGQVVGSANTSTTLRAFLWTNGSPLHDLGTLGGPDSSCAYAINGNGQVVGDAETIDRHTRAFLYDTTGSMHEIGPSSNWYATGRAINDNGQIAGYLATSEGSGYHAFFYNGNGSLLDLGTLGGATSYAVGINAAGLVVGEADTAAGYAHAFLYDGSGPLQDLGTLGQSKSAAWGINDQGQIVGYYGNKKDTRAFLWNDGAMTDLTSLIDPTSCWTLCDAAAINDAGQIVGWGINATGQSHAYLLTPLPEPSTLALLGVGAIALFGYWCRWRPV